MIEAHRCDRIWMSRKYLQRFTLSRQLFKPRETTKNYITSCNVPDTDSFIKSSGGKKIWIRIIVQTKNKIGVTKKSFHLTSL